MDDTQGRLSPDDALLLTLWSAKMSTASIAAMMGRRWSEDRVYNRLAMLRARGAGGAAAVEGESRAVAVEAAPVAAPDRRARLACDGIYRLVQGLAALKPARASPSPPRAIGGGAAPGRTVDPPFIRRGPDYSGDEDQILRDCWRDHPGRAAAAAFERLEGRSIGSIRYRAFMLGLRQGPDRGLDRRAAACRPRPRAARPAAAPPPAHTAQRIRPASGPVLRFARWFATARWSVAEIAELFDLDVDDLERALAGGGGRA